MKSITIKELKKVRNVNIIDLRASEDYNAGTIKGAVNAPSMGLMLNSKKFLNKDETYYIMCYSGNTSTMVCKALSKKGYDVVNVAGGYR